MDDNRKFNPNDWNWSRTILIALLIVLVPMIAWIAITEISGIVGNIAEHISKLFERGSINPYDKTGFSAFVELILFAIFVGFVINRFKRK